jgi:hypothetical protein
MEGNRHCIHKSISADGKGVRTLYDRTEENLDRESNRRNYRVLPKGVVRGVSPGNPERRHRRCRISEKARETTV